MKTKYVLTITVLLIALLVIGCGGQAVQEPDVEDVPAVEDAPLVQDTPTAQAEPTSAEEEVTSEREAVRVGLALSFTGPMAFIGEGADKGVAVALDALGGEVAGFPIELASADNECNPEKAISAVQRLVENDGVDIILGSGCSSATLAAMTVLEELEVAQVVSVSSSPVIAEDSGEGGNEWNFVHAVGSPILAAELVGYAAERADSVAILANNDDFGRGAVSQLQPELEARGVEIVAVEYYEIGAPDFRPLLLSIREANPEGLVLVAGETDAVQVMRQFRELDLQQQVFGLGTIATPLFLELSADEPGIGDGILNVAWYTEGMDPEFDAAYQQKWNEPPIPNAYMMYHAMRYVVAPAIEEAARLGEVNPQTLRDALERISVDTPIGTISFNEANHQAYPDIAIVTIANNQIQLQEQIASVPGSE